MTRAKASDLSERELLESHAKALEAQIAGLREELEKAEQWRDYYRAQWLGEKAVPLAPVPSESAPQLCTCRDGARYRFIRQGEDRLDTLAEEILAAVWNDIGFKGCWRERMDKRIDEAMQQLKQP